jgi:uncharacterized protein with GYD domain
MKLVVLANATDESAKDEASELERFRALEQKIEAAGASIEEAWGLLGRYDYLMILDVAEGPKDAFAAMSAIAQSGTMRTESFVAMELEAYFDLAAALAGRERA